MNDSSSNDRRTASRLTAGIILLVVGGFILASNLGFVLPYQWWSYWPHLLLALGVARLLWPGHISGRRGGGYWLVIVGLWGLINTYEWFGLSWDSSWPLFIIAAGVRVMLGGLLNRHD